MQEAKLVDLDFDGLVARRQVFTDHKTSLQANMRRANGNKTKEANRKKSLQILNKAIETADELIRKELQRIWIRQEEAGFGD